MHGFMTNLVIFIVMALGWLFKYRNKLSDAGLKDLNTLLFTVLMPASFFKAGIDFNPDLLTDWRYCVVTIGAYLASTVALWVLSGVIHGNTPLRSVTLIAGIQPNSIFIGIPLMTLWLGKEGTEAQLIYIALCMIYFNVVPTLLARVSLERVRGSAGDSALTLVVRAILAVLRNPVIMGGVVGILLRAVGLAVFIPQWAVRTLSVLSDCCTGLALLVIGASLRPQELFRDIKAAWADIAVKLIIHPLIIYIAFLLLPCGGATLMRVTVVASALPPALTCYVLANDMKIDCDYMAMLIAASTLISMVTMMFWMELVARTL